MRGSIDTPSDTDGFLRTVSPAVGGPLGRHAALGVDWWNPARVVMVVAVLVYLIGLVFRLPCRITAPGQNPDTFRLMCYSDIPLLYDSRGLLAGNIPYLDSGSYQTLEYPVLTGLFLDLERRLTAYLGGAQGTELSDTLKVESTLLFVDVNAVLLGLCLIIAIWAQIRTSVGRPWDAMLVAASPCVALAALINWDLLAVALTSLTCWAWSRRRPGWAGILLGLAVAAKLYPVFLLGPLLVLCLRGRRMQEFGVTAGAAVISWSAVNLPVMILAPEAWRYFWTFNADREGDLGSIWYVLKLAGHPVTGLNDVSTTILLLACAAIGLLGLLAPRRPRFGQLAFLVIAAFLITNKVYSPQYVLWLLPLLALARPRWRDWWIFTAGEVFYFAAIWWHLDGVLAPGAGSDQRIYWLAVVLRILTQSWICLQIVRDILRPERDPVRADGADDPAGGVLDGADDAAWLRRLRPGDRAGDDPAAADPASVAPASVAPVSVASAPVPPASVDAVGEAVRDDQHHG